jgi:hypothetical protein
MSTTCQTNLRPGSAASNLSLNRGYARPSSAASTHFRTVSACSLRSGDRTTYEPSPLQQSYDASPSIGVFKQQLRSNSWFLTNQRAPSQLRVGKSLFKEMTSFHSTLRPPSASSVAKSHNISRPSTSATTAWKLRSEIGASRSREVFGLIEEDHVDLVRNLSTWAPALHEAKPESLPSHYRTTTKHGSTAHTIWDFVWEKPVNRDTRIIQEINLKEEWEL